MPVYLLDSAGFKPPEELKVNVEECEKVGHHWPQYREDVVDFMRKIFVKSGIGSNATYLMKNVHPQHTNEPYLNLNTAAEEAEMVMCGAVQELLDRTGFKATDIDILVTCCSIYCATPSVASMLVNKFKMRNDIQSYHLGGMGCGTGVIAVNLVKDLLTAHPNSLALFVPTEVTNYSAYRGEEPNRMVANVIFRMGGAAALFTNRPSLARRAKYELLHSVRVHHGANDDAYRCMSWGPDKKGINGVYLGKNVIKCASAVVTETLSKTVRKVMPLHMYLAYAANYATRHVLGYKNVPKYEVDFTKCFDHFLIHAGGYAVLKGIQERTKISDVKMIPSFAVLREYGNTSCSTTWYSLGYLETCEGVAKGEIVLQMGVGGGMKAGANVWRAMRNLPRTREHRAWAHLYDTPITEADLPRGITLGDIRDLTSKRLAEEGVRVYKTPAAAPAKENGAEGSGAPYGTAAHAADGAVINGTANGNGAAPPSPPAAAAADDDEVSALADNAV